MKVGGAERRGDGGISLIVVGESECLPPVLLSALPSLSLLASSPRTMNGPQNAIKKKFPASFFYFILPSGADSFVFICPVVR